jgi:hypothetical protein
MTKTIPRRVWDAISSRATILSLFEGMTAKDARAQALREVAHDEKIKASRLRSSKPPQASPKNVNSGIYRDAMFVYNALMRPLQPVIDRFSPSSSTSSTVSPVTGEPQIVRRARRSKPSPPPVEPPATKHALPLLYTDGQRSSRGTNINHEFSDSPATKTWRQQNQRE